jgi:hypothetical protein
VALGRVVVAGVPVLVNPLLEAHLAARQSESLRNFRTKPLKRLKPDDLDVDAVVLDAAARQDHPVGDLRGEPCASSRHSGVPPEKPAIIHSRILTEKRPLP